MSSPAARLFFYCTAWTLPIQEIRVWQVRHEIFDNYEDKAKNHNAFIEEHAREAALLLERAGIKSFKKNDTRHRDLVGATMDRVAEVIETKISDLKINSIIDRNRYEG